MAIPAGSSCVPTAVEPGRSRARGTHVVTLVSSVVVLLFWAEPAPAQKDNGYTAARGKAFSERARPLRADGGPVAFKASGGGAGQFDPFCDDCMVGSFSCGDSVSAGAGESPCDDQEFSFHVWELEISEPTAVRLTVQQPGAEAPFLTLFDNACQFIAGEDIGGGIERNLGAGSYRVLIETFGGVSAPYTLRASCSEIVLCDECPAEAVACESTADGALAAGDCRVTGDRFADRYTFELAEAARVTIRMQSPSVDSFLFLNDANCVQIAEADDCGESLDSCLVADLEAGTYSVLASSYDVAETGNYTLTIGCALGFDPCLDCLVGTLECDGSITGALAGDECQLAEQSLFDLYQLDVVEAGRFVVDMRSAALDSYLVLFDESFERILEADDCGDSLNSCLTADLVAGTYFVAASSFFPGATGSYTVALRCVPGFDLCTDCVVEPVPCGESVTVSFPRTACTDSTMAQTDLFPLTLERPGPLIVGVRSLDLVPFLSLLDGSCQPIDAELPLLVPQPDGSFSQELTVPDLEPGDYFLQVADFATTPGQLTIETSCPDVGFCLDCTVGDLDCDATVEGALDLQSCALPSGGRGELWRLETDGIDNLVVTAVADGFEPRVRLLDVHCEPLAAASCDEGRCRQFAALPGIYYVEVSGDSGEAAGAYQLSLGCDEFDPCRDCPLGEISCGAEVSANFRETSCPSTESFGDAGAWSFRLEEFQRVEFELQTGAEVYPFLSIADSDCFEVSFGGGFDATVARVVADLPPGEYVVFPFADVDGPYTLTMACGDPVKCTDCVVGTVTCGESIRGGLSREDCELGDSTRLDAYTLNLQEAGPVDIELGAVAFDTLLTVFDSECALVAVNDDCAGTNSCLSLQLEAGTYLIGVQNFFPGELGTYLLEVTADGCDQCVSCEDNTLEPGQEAVGTLDPESCGRAEGQPADVWELTVPAGEAPLQIELQSDAFDPFLSIRDAECQEIANNDDCTLETLNSCLSVTLEAGSYRLVVGSFLPGVSGEYRLAVGVTDSGSVLPGDCDGDRMLTIDDALCLLEPLFLTRDVSLLCGDGSPRHAANIALLDFDGGRELTISDGIRLLRFLFLGGVPHPLGHDCVVIPDCPGSCDS